MTDEPTPATPGGAEEPDDADSSRGSEATNLLESAAELGLGAVIAPFTGGETVNIVGSVASMLEAGVDRLTHPGQHETVPDDPADPDSDTVRPQPGVEDPAADGLE